MRKHYLDHLRVFTILLVVIYHSFFYYNNIGANAIFAGATEYTASGKMTFAGVFQYAVYPWFMELLFVIAGISSYYALQKRTDKEFRRERTRKLLVPSTLGILCFGWITGSILVTINADKEFEMLPFAIKALIFTLSGIGVLWFCQVLFLASLLLLVVRKIERKCDPQGKFRSLCEKSNLLVVLLLFIPVWGASQILSVELISCYRFGTYFMSFFIGYYVFANDKVQEICEKWAWLLMGLGISSGVYYIYRSYGTSYVDASLLKSWYSSLFGYLMVPALIGIAKKYFNFTNNWLAFMKKESFGLYVVHITPMVIVAYLIMRFEMPIACRYLILAVSGLVGGLALEMIIKKIPIVRYVVLGIRKEKA